MTEEEFFLGLIAAQKQKMRPGLDGAQIDVIENEIYKLQGLLERARREKNEGKET